MPRRTRQEALAAVRAVPSAWPVRQRRQASPAPESGRPYEAAPGQELPPAAAELFRRLDRIEAQNFELRQQNQELLHLIRGLVAKPPPARLERPARPKVKMIDGQPWVWGGEGTGWIRFYGPAAWFDEPDEPSAIGPVAKPPRRAP